MVYYAWISKEDYRLGRVSLSAYNDEDQEEMARRMAIVFVETVLNGDGFVLEIPGRGFKVERNGSGQYDLEGRLTRRNHKAYSIIEEGELREEFKEAS
tara:strand:- start:3456 stop:3749 length:294 start_codon:yes stop_codon:yes gene_type:complete